MQRILIIDDDQIVCKSLQLLLRRAGYAADYNLHPEQGLATLAKQPVDLILLDMNFSISSSGKAGLTALENILEEYPQIPIILITAWASVQLAVEGMKRGARDFLAKPWENDHLLSFVHTIRVRRLQTAA
ncbi:MAG: response regulator, partial [Bacteroidota bacterium]